MFPYSFRTSTLRLASFAYRASVVSSLSKAAECVAPVPCPAALASRSWTGVRCPNFSDGVNDVCAEWTNLLARLAKRRKDLLLLRGGGGVQFLHEYLLPCDLLLEEFLPSR